MNRLARSTSHHSCLASATVSAVSWASRGSTSIETRPSTPADASYAGRITSQAQRTSYVVIMRPASSTATPRAARSWICSAYSSDSASALAKMVGLRGDADDVLVATQRVQAAGDQSSREMSSSQMETPAADELGQSVGHSPVPSVAAPWLAVAQLPVVEPCRLSCAGQRRASRRDDVVRR